jgi:uncharacterized membrane protein
MTSAIINALDTSPLPTWLVVLLMVVVFIVVSVTTAYFTYKSLAAKIKGKQVPDDDGKSSE